MKQLQNIQKIQQHEVDKTIFDEVYASTKKSSYLPEVLLFLPMPIMLFLILGAEQIGLSKNFISMLWLTLFSNAFIFLFVFTKIYIQIPRGKRAFSNSAQLITAEGFLLESTIQSAARSFYYFEEFTGTRVPVINVRDQAFPTEVSGQALLVEELPGQYTILNFTPFVETTEEQ